MPSTVCSPNAVPAARLRGDFEATAHNKATGLPKARRSVELLVILACAALAGFDVASTPAFLFFHSVRFRPTADPFATVPQKPRCYPSVRETDTARTRRDRNINRKLPTTAPELIVLLRLPPLAHFGFAQPSGSSSSAIRRTPYLATFSPTSRLGLVTPIPLKWQLAC